MKYTILVVLIVLAIAYYFRDDIAPGSLNAGPAINTAIPSAMGNVGRAVGGTLSKSTDSFR